MKWHLESLYFSFLFLCLLDFFLMFCLSVFVLFWFFFSFFFSFFFYILLLFIGWGCVCFKRESMQWILKLTRIKTNEANRILEIFPKRKKKRFVCILLWRFFVLQSVRDFSDDVVLLGKQMKFVLTFLITYQLGLLFNYCCHLYSHHYFLIFISSVWFG